MIGSFGSQKSKVRAPAGSRADLSGGASQPQIKHVAKEAESIKVKLTFSPGLKSESDNSGIQVSADVTCFSCAAD